MGDVVRQFIQKMGTVVNPELGLDLNGILISDSGNVGEDVETLEEAHQLLEDRVSQIIQCGATPFVVGGGNDQSFPNVSGLLRNCQNPDSVTVINVDAHLDVRPLKEGKVHSGSPFYLMLQSGKYFMKSRFSE